MTWTQRPHIPETWQAWTSFGRYTLQRDGEDWAVLCGSGWRAHFPTREEAQAFCEGWDDCFRERVEEKL